MRESLQSMQEIHAGVGSNVVVDHMPDRTVRFAHIFLRKAPFEKHALNDLDVTPLVGDGRHDGADNFAPVHPDGCCAICMAWSRRSVSPLSK